MPITLPIYLNKTLNLQQKQSPGKERSNRSPIGSPISKIDKYETMRMQNFRTNIKENNLKKQYPS